MPTYTIHSALVSMNHKANRAPWNYLKWQETTGIHYGLFPSEDDQLSKDWTHKTAQNIHSYFKMYKKKHKEWLCSLRELLTFLASNFGENGFATCERKKKCNLKLSFCSLKKTCIRSSLWGIWLTKNGCRGPCMLCKHLMQLAWSSLVKCQAISHSNHPVYLE